MFETSFSHSSTTPIPPNLPITSAVDLLHDFEFVIKLSPDCRGCKPAQPKNGYTRSNGQTNGTTLLGEKQHWEVEDDLPFIPKRLWAGGVKYRADFIPVADGCDITVYAPGGFTSTNHWRLLREAGQDGDDEVERAMSKDLLHAESAGAGWYLHLTSDASCNRTYAGFVKGFLKNTQTQLQQRFIERLSETPKQQQKPRRPGMGRRNSSVL